MGVSNVLLGVAGLAAGAAILCNLPTNPFVANPSRATLKYLASATLKTVEATPKDFPEALGLSSLRPELDARGVALYAVVHEPQGVPKFRPFLKGDVFLDEKRIFFGPVERRIFYSAFLRAKVWMNIINNNKKKIDGDYKGEGRILGGVFVIGPGSQGVIFEHREKEFGDYANLTDVLEAVKQIK